MVRRLKSILVTGECLGCLARSGTVLVDVNSDVPATAKFVTAYYSDDRRSFVCVFEDDSFPEIPEGTLLKLEDNPVRAFEVSSLSNVLAQLSSCSKWIVRRALRTAVDNAPHRGVSDALVAIMRLFEPTKNVSNDSPCVSTE